MKDFFNFTLFCSAGAILLISYLFIYIRLTPYSEIDLIRKGNIAAACSLSGTLIGYALALSSAIRLSVSMLDMVLWGFFALIVQLVAYLFIRFIFLPDIKSKILGNNIAAGIITGAISSAFGLINAAAMTN
jgi:putative membrane protein